MSSPAPQTAYAAGGEGDAILAAVAEAGSFRDWSLDLVRPYLGRRLLEAGCGQGTFTRALLPCARLVAVDREPRYVDALRAEHGADRAVRVEVLDLEDEEALAALAGERLDTALAVNVLEHLDAPGAALAGFRRLLVPGGRAVVVVPAWAGLFGSLDEAVGHRRRYDPAALRAALAAAGFQVEACFGFNRLASPGWFWRGRVLGSRRLPVTWMRAYDALVPLARRLDRWLPTPPLSLVGVGRVPLS